MKILVINNLLEEKHIELMKSEKHKFQDEKKKLNKEMKDQKESVINRFNQIVKGKTKIDSEIVKELYPEDHELYQKIKSMEEKYKLKSENNDKDNNNNGDNDESNKKSKSREKSAKQREKEKEIERKVENFRKKLREELSKEIEKEKNNEQRRIEELEKAKNSDERIKIEKKITKERNESKKIITDKSDNLEMFVEEYRKTLIENLFHY
jgi:hypothetical protein